MASSGMLLALFLLAHVAGNLVILLSASKFNEYAHMLTSNLPLLYAAEAGLIAITLIHIAVAIQITRMNKTARPIAYQVKQNTGRSRRWWGSSNMGITGTFILLFIIYHILHFKFGANYTTIENGVEVRDLARLVFEEFKEPFEVGLYVVAMILIGMHLMHGFRSIWDTMGLNDSKRDCLIKNATRLYVVLVFGGFLAIPLWIFFFGSAS